MVIPGIAPGEVKWWGLSLDGDDLDLEVENGVTRLIAGLVGEVTAVDVGDEPGLVAEVELDHLDLAVVADTDGVVEGDVVDDLPVAVSGDGEGGGAEAVAGLLVLLLSVGDDSSGSVRVGLSLLGHVGDDHVVSGRGDRGRPSVDGGDVGHSSVGQVVVVDGLELGLGHLLDDGHGESGPGLLVEVGSSGVSVLDGDLDLVPDLVADDGVAESCQDVGSSDLEGQGAVAGLVEAVGFDDGVVLADSWTC